MRSRSIAGAALLLAVAAGLSACASIWGFQEGIEGSDASTESGGADGKAEPDTTSTDTTPMADATTEGRSDSSSAETGVTDGGTDASNEAATQEAAQNDVEEAGDVAEPDAQSDASDSGVVGACSQACVPTAPSGWQGPFEIDEATPSTLQSCGGSYPTQAFIGMGSLDAGPAQCSCTCTPSGVSCTEAIANFGSNSTCAGCGTADQVIGTTCTTFDLGSSCGFGPQVAVTAGTPSGGSCTPSGTASVPPVGWMSAVLLCAPGTMPAGAGCDAGQLCMPPPGLGFTQSTYCVASTSADAAACPPDYPVLKTYYASVSGTDTRACTACGCGAHSGGACGGTVSTYGSGCPGSANGSWTVPQSCASLGFSAKAGIYNPAVTDAGSCPTSGGVPTGTFTPTATPTTICCTQ